MREARTGVDVHDQTLDPTTDNNPCKTRDSESVVETDSDYFLRRGKARGRRLRAASDAW
ncbi:hypothetical protein GCM10023317_77330 [Actinopolymorpha pittospori]